MDAIETGLCQDCRSKQENGNEMVSLLFDKRGHGTSNRGRRMSITVLVNIEMQENYSLDKNPNRAGGIP